MRYVVYIAVLLLLAAAPAYAEIAKPTCDELKAGYDALASVPISAEDGTLSIVINGLVDNRLLAKDQTKTEYATREQVAEYLAGLPPVDALIWASRQFDYLETGLKKNSCGYEAKRIVLMAPKPVTPTCKTTGPLPKKVR